MSEEKNETKAEKLTDEQILDAINSPSISINPNFVNLGKELLDAAKDYLACYGLARKIFTCRIPKPNEEIRYNKDENVAAYIVDGDKKVKKIEKGYHVYPLEFEVLTYLKLTQEKFNSIDKAKKAVGDKQEQAIYSLMYQEDDPAIRLLMEAGKENEIVTGSLKETLNGLIASFDKKRLICDKILLNKKDADKVIKEAVDGELKNWIDPVSKRCLIEAGYIGTYRNTMLITTAVTAKDRLKDRRELFDNVLPEGMPIALTAPEYLGGLINKVCLFSEPLSEYKMGEKHRFGWFWYEVLSMLVMNPNAVVLGQIKY